MGKIITYKNSPSGKFCQIKYEDGNRILISLAQTGIRISKLKWAGLVPSKIIFDISTTDMVSDKYKATREKLTEVSLEPDLLDVFKDLLLPCNSLGEVKNKLNEIFVS